jgi:chemotaxis signal transduction protein
MGAEFLSLYCGKYLIFHLSDSAYAVATTCVEEIVPMAELIPVPGSPNFLTGFLNVGGDTFGAISMRRLFGMADQERQLYTPLIILKGLTMNIALEVDEVARVVDIGVDDLVSNAEGSSLNDCAVAVARIEGHAVVVLSPERLLLHQEQKRVTEMADLAQQRLAELELETAR